MQITASEVNQQETENEESPDNRHPYFIKLKIKNKPDSNLIFFIPLDKVLVNISYNAELKFVVMFD